jgi:hypothetical protein
VGNLKIILNDANLEHVAAYFSYLGCEMYVIVIRILSIRDVHRTVKNSHT